MKKNIYIHKIEIIDAILFFIILFDLNIFRSLCKLNISNSFTTTTTAYLIKFKIKQF